MRAALCLSRQARTVRQRATRLHGRRIREGSSRFHRPRLEQSSRPISTTRQSVSGISRTVRFKVLQECGFRCVYCGRKAGRDVILEIDHRHPRSAGGSNRRQNLVAACFDCNRGKHAHPLLVASTATITADLQTCCDCCPYCPVELLVIRPITMLRESDSVVMRYRCRRGHEWTTCWDAELAQMNARGIVEEEIPMWPARIQG